MLWEGSVLDPNEVRTMELVPLDSAQTRSRVSASTVERFPTVRKSFRLRLEVQR